MFVDINNKYSKSVLGDIEIIVMKENGYVNATKLCQEFGKKLNDWYVNKYSKELIKEVENYIGNKSTIKVIGGDINNAYFRGTYVHPLMITDVARWISANFAFKIYLWIEEWKNFSQINDKKYWNAISNMTPSINDQRELKIKLKLNKSLKGEMEVETDNGFIDILTDKKIIEVKSANFYKQALGQILAYGIYYPKKQKVIYLFDLNNDFNIDKVKKLYDKYDVKLKIIDSDYI